ncbi:hypothetical protein [Devosia ginsengisoli]|uniref:hypothetical protein n=1 Tax=Devosia ginsengisoli TaxID=400770 RepID=UPI0026F15575|nr:hypothetical protein [Devosia ginsengisoli]MCR6671535.1 hypothetical protein [Devosia ginsengisoli]
MFSAREHERADAGNVPAGAGGRVLGIFTRFRDNDPLTTRREADAERLKSLLADEGVALFQTTGYWQNLVTSDETARAQSVKVLQAALKLSGWMGGARHRHRPGLDES